MLVRTNVARSIAAPDGNQREEQDDGARRERIEPVDAEQEPGGDDDEEPLEDGEGEPPEGLAQRRSCPRSSASSTPARDAEGGVVTSATAPVIEVRNMNRMTWLSAPTA